MFAAAGEVSYGISKDICGQARGEERELKKRNSIPVQCNRVVGIGLGG